LRSTPHPTFVDFTQDSVRHRRVAVALEQDGVAKKSKSLFYGIECQAL
jgi:hypothetical protein